MAAAGRLAASQHLTQVSQAAYACGCTETRLSRRRNAMASAGGSDEDDNRDKGKNERSSIDWDSAWSSYRKPKKASGNPFKLDMDKYVSRRPTRSDYPLSEEVDPLRKSERSALGVWTDPRFTYAGIGVIVGLFVYMVIIIGPPPS